MKTSRPDALHVLVLLMLITGAAAAALGVFFTTGGEPFEVTNSSGDVVRIYGEGIYARDSYFKAPIFRGTDLTILLVAVPLLTFALAQDYRARTLKARVLLASVIGIFVYYSTSIAFGVTYNNLMLLYIAFFSASLFALILAMRSIDYARVAQSIGPGLPRRGIYAFLWLTGVALFVAWLPDILTALAANRSLALIEVYTTEITYVMDMGIITPVALLAYFLMKKPSAAERGMGLVLAEMMLTLCMVIGVMLPVQSVFQTAAGIEIPVPALITKLGIFVLLALFAAYFNLRLLRSWKQPEETL